MTVGGRNPMPVKLPPLNINKGNTFFRGKKLLGPIRTISNGNGIRGNRVNRVNSSNNITGNSSSSRGNRVNRVNSSNNNTRNSISSSEGKDMPKLTKKDFLIFIVTILFVGGCLFGIGFLIYLASKTENDYERMGIILVLITIFFGFLLSII